MFQSTPVTGRNSLEEVTPLPVAIIPLKGKVSNWSLFLMNKSTNNHLDYPPIVVGSSLDTHICFAIGELEREQLEETAANAGVAFDKWTSEDDLRASLIQAARDNGGIQIYDEEGGCLTLGLDAVRASPVFDPTAEVPIPGPQGSKPEYYIWTDAGNCDNKTTDLLEAVKWRNEFRAEGEGGYIADVDNNALSDAEILALLVAEKFGADSTADTFRALFCDAVSGLKEYYGELLEDGDVVAGLKIIARDRFVHSGNAQEDYQGIRDCIEKYLVADPEVEVAAVLKGIRDAIRKISPNPLIKATLENDNGSEEIEFHASDVLAHHMPGSTHGWNDLSEQDQQSFAEDYALWAFKRKHGDHTEYRVDVEIAAS